MTRGIAWARESDMPALQKIWNTGFASPNGDISGVAFIFERLLKPENMLVLRAGGEPAATLTVQDFELTSQTGPIKAAYVYGVVTAPEHRGRGYSTAILQYADSLLQENGYKAAVLVPASESLFGFYENRGYETAFRLNRASVMAAELTPGQTPEPVNAAWLMEAREAAFGSSPMFVRWPLEYMRYIAEECEFYGGGVYSAGAMCAACQCYGSTVVVKELAGASGNVQVAEALAALRGKFPAAKRFELNLREDIHTVYTNNLLPFGMIKWYDKDVKRQAGGVCGYLTHALD
jgi:GNAT superfamily N-acetyltransferase